MYSQCYQYLCCYYLPPQGQPLPLRPVYRLCQCLTLTTLSAILKYAGHQWYVINGYLWLWVITFHLQGGSVSVYTVRVIGDGGAFVGHGSTKCTTSPCLYVQQVYVSDTSYTIFVASINGDGEEGPENNITIISKEWNIVIKSKYCMVI